MTVNVENMRAWVAALRSGQYKQGKSYLRSDKYGGPARVDVKGTDYHYCCLGVACEVWSTLTGEKHDYDTFNGVLNSTVLSFFELPADNPVLNLREPIDLGSAPQLKADAASLNDSAGFTFEQIADAIEYTYPEVKVQTGEETD